MKIDNTHSSTKQFFTHIVSFNKRWINYTVEEPTIVIFKYKGSTYKIKVNPLLVEDGIIKYILKEEL